VKPRGLFEAQRNIEEERLARGMDRKRDWAKEIEGRGIGIEK
jgi:hypothetical protein